MKEQKSYMKWLIAILIIASNTGNLIAAGHSLRSVLQYPPAILFSGGTGTTGDPYLVSNSTDLNNVRNYLSSNFKQTCDINISSYANWTPIGSSSSSTFTGSYDGNGYKVTGLTITAYASGGAGLFGYNSGTIKNLGVTGNVSGVTNSGAGILAGSNYTNGIIINCYSEGSVSSSSNYIGGLCGHAGNYSSISKSYSTATVTATGSNSTNVGGFVGYCAGTTGTIDECYSTGNVNNNGPLTSNNANTGGFAGAVVFSISNCYSTGNVYVNGQTGTFYSGGFIGRTTNFTTPQINYTNCYSTGKVSGNVVMGGFVGYYNLGSFSGCYFNADSTSSLSASGANASSAPSGITGKTTAQMKTSATYSGWSSSVWSIVNGSYPQFTWAITIPAASTYTGTGNWSVVANWSNGLPGATTSVTIDGQCTVESDYTCANLTINAGKVLTIDPNNCLTVSGTLTNNAGISGLVLASTSAGNGTLLNNTAGVSATVKQFLTKNKWHYIGIPVNYVADVADVLYHAYVLLIDESYAYDAISTGWSYLETGDSLIKLHGYAVNYTYPGNSDTTITFTGVLNTGVIDTLFDSETEGWNFISNPYPCTMDWDAAGGKTITNGNDAFYVWQPTSEVYGTYGSYITGGSTNGQTRYISSNQGFFFQVWATSAAIEFTNSAKVSNSVLFSLNDSNPVNFKPVLDENEPPLELLKEKSLLLGVTDDGTHFDETLIRTNLFARTDFDSNLDASKLIAFESKTPQIFSISNGREYSINTIPKIEENLIIPITILSKSNQSQILSIRSLQNMDENQPINLYDSEGVYLCDLSLSDYSYTGEAGMEKTFYVSLEPVKKSAIADFHQTVENSRKKFQRITIKQLNQAAFMVQSTVKSHSDNQSSSLIK